MTMDYTEAFRRSMRTLKTWADQHLNPQSSRIVLRSYSSVHYRYRTLHFVFLFDSGLMLIPYM